MYETLLYKHHLSHEIAKLIEFKDENTVPIQAYVFTKDNKKYLLDKDNDTGTDNLAKLPIRVDNTIVETAKSNDVVYKILAHHSFSVMPKKEYTFSELVNLDKIVHPIQDEYRLYKIMAWSARIGRIAVRFSSNPAWGKTSYFKLINHLYEKSYVVKPRSLPGIVRGITEDGVMVLDEVSDIKAEVKPELFNALSQLGEFSNVLTLGTAGSTAHHTKPVYNVRNLSCVILYNRLNDYKKKEDFFDYSFSNTEALNDRYFPLRPTDASLDNKQFDDGQYMVLTDEIRKTFLSYIKAAEYYNQHWSGLVDHDFVKESLAKYDITGRHMTSFRCIASFIYLFSLDKDDNAKKEVYYYYLTMLYGWHMNYLRCLNPEYDAPKRGELNVYA